MKEKIIFFVITVTLFTPTLVAAESQYGSMEVYYNDDILLGKEIAKPVLKIGEPFKLKINLTVNQKSDVYVSLSCMEKSSFEIIDGPSLRIDDYSDGDVLEAKSSMEYEWTVKTTERWSGGSLPLDIYYGIYSHGSPEPLVNGGFTVIYPYISTEYYEGKTPESSSSETETSSESTPAFTTFGTFLAVALAASRR